MKDTTCKNCEYAYDCIMYDPHMKRCDVYKERRAKDDKKQVPDILSEEKETYEMVRKM